MTALTEAQLFYTFHSNTTAVPAEITSQILNHIVADARPLPLGGGVTTRTTNHAVASVSQTFRSIYVGYPYLTSTKRKVAAPIKVSIGEVLEFSDLRTLAAFFEDGAGRDAKIYSAFGSSVYHIETTILPQAEEDGLPAMHTKLLSTFTNIGI